MCIRQTALVTLYCDVPKRKQTEFDWALCILAPKQTSVWQRGGRREPDMSMVIFVPVYTGPDKRVFDYIFIFLLVLISFR